MTFRARLSALPGWIAVFLLLLSGGTRLHAADAAHQLGVEFNPDGLAALRYGGSDYLLDGGFRVVEAQLETLDGTRVEHPLKGGQFRFNPKSQTALWHYSWGTATCTYRAVKNRLNLTLQVVDTGPNVLRGIALQPLTIRFPHEPRNWPQGWPLLGHNLGGPTLLTVDVESRTLVVANEELGRPLLVGFPGRPSRTDRPLWVASYNGDHWLSPYLDPYLTRPIYPGGRDTYRISLRFGPAGAKASALASDVIEKFRAAYPYQLNWTDRRPMGALFLSSAPPHHPNNPRGWLNNASDIDTTTDEGRARFRERMLRYADDSIQILKGMDAQGMIAWDIEGQEHPHATSYLGDPRSLPPEIEPVIDEFFKKFTDAGLRVGLTLRPQLPHRPAYGDKVDQYEVPDPAANLNEKVEYAQKRWGCTLFYVDSNGDPNVPFPVEVFQKVALAHPDVLLIPEHENARYYAYTAPFNSFLHQGITGTSADVRAVYSQAFSVIYAPDGPIAEHRRELVDSVRRGDILLFHGWWPNPNNALLKSILDEAKR